MDENEVLIRLENPKPLTVGNKVFRSVHDWKLTEEDLEKAALEIGETAEKREESLRKLKEKLSSKWNPEEVTYDELAISIVNVLDIVSMNPHCQINGAIGIYDLSDWTLRHIKEVMSHGRLWKIVTLAQTGYPWRIKNAYILNTNRLVRFFFSIVKPLMERKIRERVVLLGSDINELHQYVNPVLLPKKLNGTLEVDECDMTQHVFNNLEYLRYEKSFV